MFPYQYSNLSTPTSIRLLVVSGSHDDPSYEIEEVELTDKPRFEALSYTWNDYDNENSEHVEGGTNTYTSITIASVGSLKVTLHLAGILRRIHGLLVEPESTGRIWIDQIAVNQRNLDERGQQVSLMHQIYGQAERTLMWIGMSAEHTPVLLNLVQNLPGPLEVEWNIDMLEGLQSQLLAIFNQEGGLHCLYTKAQYLRSLDWLLGRPYFKRAWIVQEIVLSTRPTVVLQSTPSDLYILHRIIFIIRWSADSNLRNTYSLTRNRVGVDRLLSIDTARRWLRGDPTYSALYGDFLDVLFWLSSSREASDPKDFIYAFSALQKDHTSSHLVVDYKISVAQAYRTFCLVIARETGSLAFLGLVRGSADPEIPSWTVDWRMDVSSAKDQWQGYRIGDTRHYPYAAAKGRTSRAIGMKQGDDMRFVVRGRIVDTVQFVSCVIRETIATSGLENVRLAEEISSIRTPMPTVDVDTSAEVKLVKERVFVTLLGLDRDPQPLEDALRYTTEDLLSMYEKFIDTETSDAVSEEIYKQRFSYTDLRLMHKRLFLGRKQLFGFGPNAVLSGDYICIVHGSTVPLLLRRCENGKEYTVVGQCYYETWMYGEKVDWEEDEADEFVLV